MLKKEREMIKQTKQATWKWIVLSIGLISLLSGSFFIIFVEKLQYGIPCFALTLLADIILVTHYGTDSRRSKMSSISSMVVGLTFISLFPYRVPYYIMVPVSLVLVIIGLAPIFQILRKRSSSSIVN